MPMKLVIFDVDGTLLDSQHAIVAAMAEAYLQHGLPAPTREAVRAIVGLSVAEAVAELSAEASDHPLQDIGEAFKRSFMESRRSSPDGMALYPGALEIIGALAARQDVLLGLATGNSRRGVAHFLERFGLEDRFVTRQTADDAPSKPHPAMVLQAVAEAGVAAECAVMIGDTTFDMEMARAAGARAIGVAWGYHPRERLLAAGAETILESFEELPGVLGLLDAVEAA
ncbi:HAD-IA family hydrolase [Hansschlegelia beijingensis]|uniref:HAD-IA family hydrolase n=1 Tax=Hansschlegelia beijingensis TaxID=1133344 RepID=UPI00387F2085